MRGVVSGGVIRDSSSVRNSDVISHSCNVRGGVSGGVNQLVTVVQT